ncbi:hypothetical protein C8R43DRAFT_1067998 [Mycena crocata]|nr:hypothetical protein C8R43DRAFT_1067998 [Mycena crocata]
MKTTSAIILITSAASAYGHAVITSVIGANGVKTMGMGVSDIASTVPRTGTSEQPFQLDTPVLKNLKDDPCGATLQGGSINIATAMKTALAQGGGGLPSFEADGTINMEIHQVNADGGGPFTAMVNADATGKTWVAATVTVQAPGANGILHGGPANVPFAAQLPAGTKCTGGQDGATCLIRINNGGTGNTLSLAQGAGPFGGCVATNATTAATGNAGKIASLKAKLAAAIAAKKAKAQNAAATQAARRFSSRHFYPTIESREEAIAKFTRSTQLLNNIAEIVARGELTADLIDEIKTATGTAIDIPIDNLAGHDDAADLGGNSTTPTGAVLTAQQATDLKKAVSKAIATALGVLSSGGDVVAKGAQDLEETAKANEEAAAALIDGSLTSINLGNAGVAAPQTAVVDSLLGPLATILIAQGAAPTGAGKGADKGTVEATAVDASDAAVATETVAATAVAAAAITPAASTGRGRFRNAKNRAGN